MLLEDRSLVDAVLDDYLSSPLSDKDKALFAFIDRMNAADSGRMVADDLDGVRAAGWSDEALYDAITVCSLFNFYNKWIDASGVSDMPAAAYAASGERLASRGYVPG